MPSGCVPTLRCSSLPPTHTFTRGGGHESDGTPTCSNSQGVKTIVEHGANSYACSFDKDCASTTPAVFIPSPSSPPLPTRGGASLAEPSSCHRPSVLEMAHLASSLVRPAGYVEAEAPPSPNAVPWHIDLCQLGPGKSTSTSDPPKKTSGPEGSEPSIPHPQPAAATAEEGPTTQKTASSPRSKAPAPCSRFCMPLIIWATQTSAASDLLGVGECGSTFTPYVSPTTAASTIQKAYRYYTVRRVTRQERRWQIQLLLAHIELEHNMTCAMRELQDSKDFVYSVCDYYWILNVYPG